MNWINTEIDPFVIVSNSDAHSLENMGREGNIIEWMSDDNQMICQMIWVEENLKKIRRKSEESLISNYRQLSVGSSEEDLKKE